MQSFARPRRAVLVVPATDRRKLEKAAGLEVDAVIVDLEDAVPADRKTDETRLAAADAVVGLAWRAATVSVRVNAVETRWFADDIRTIVAHAGSVLATIVIPKVESGAMVGQVVAALDAAGARLELGVEAQVENALGLVRVEEIAASSDRLETLVFGAGDYAASMSMPLGPLGGIDPAYPGDQWAYPRARIAVAARAFGLEPIDSPFAEYRDAQGLAESSRRARFLGFGGKWAIHPGQVDDITIAFSPTDEEVAAAERTLALLDEAAGGGQGAANASGAMIDEASRRQAAAVLARARRPPLEA